MDRQEKTCKSVGDYLNIILEENKKLPNDENLEKKKKRF